VLTTSVQRQMHEFIEGLLRHKSDMVNIEAARAICDMKNVTAADLVRPVAGKSLEIEHY
jgi:coatomer protein complex subunit gamma